MGMLNMRLMCKTQVGANWVESIVARPMSVQCSLRLGNQQRIQIWIVSVILLMYQSIAWCQQSMS